MKSQQWVHLAIMVAGCVGLVAIDLLRGHYSLAGMFALMMVVGLYASRDIDANEKEERIDELQREVRLLASMIDGDKRRPAGEPPETGIIEK